MIKKLLFIFIVLCLFLMASCGNEGSVNVPKVDSKDKATVEDKLSSDSEIKVLVAYFSRGDENYSVGNVTKGNTQKIAEYIAEQIGAETYHIETVVPYPADYDGCKDRAEAEKNDNARPEIIGNVENMDEYDIVFLGYPIWWGEMPMAVYTFLESYDFSGKVIIPFNTHEGSGNAGTNAKIKAALPSSEVLSSLVIRGSIAQKLSTDTQKDIRNWLAELGF